MKLLTNYYRSSDYNQLKKYQMLIMWQQLPHFLKTHVTFEVNGKLSGNYLFVNLKIQIENCVVATNKPQSHLEINQNVPVCLSCD